MTADKSYSVVIAYAVYTCLMRRLKVRQCTIHDIDLLGTEGRRA